MKIVDYVECFPDGAGKGKSILKACSDARIEGFPTWVINGQVYNRLSFSSFNSYFM